MQTLTYGLQQPESGDKGSIFFPALEENIAQLDAHTHDGSTSSKIASSGITPVTQSITAGSWVASGNTYRQLVTVPGAITIDDKVPVFKDPTTLERYYLPIEKVTAATYYVYCNDNTVAVTAYYL